MHLYTYMYIYYVVFVLLEILLISKYFIIVWYFKCIENQMQMPMYPPLKFRKLFCIFPFWLETFYKSLLSCNIQYLQYSVCIKLKCTLKNLPQHPVLELGPVATFESTCHSSASAYWHPVPCHQETLFWLLCLFFSCLSHMYLALFWPLRAAWKPVSKQWFKASGI